MNLSQINPRYHAQIAAATKPKTLGILREKDDAKTFISVTGKLCEMPKGKTVRQRTGDGLNRWEREFQSVLIAAMPQFTIHREVSLPLANGVRYKVDFMMGQIGHIPLAYEVKGRNRPTGTVKIKVAAKEYPWITFILVTKKDGAWHEQVILP